VLYGGCRCGSQSAMFVVLSLQDFADKVVV